MTASRNVAILGAGTMGHALALVFALGGHRVRLTDSHAETLARAPALMAGALATLREAGEAPAERDDAWLEGAVRRDADLASCLEGAEIVVEAIVEEPEAKRALFARLDVLLPSETIIASNTSYLDIFPLVPAARRARTLIAHWYSPPYLIDLVDLVAGPETDPAVVETMRALVEALGKKPVVMARFISGYIANRLQSAIGLEVNRLIDEGYATPRDIDEAIIHGLAPRWPILGHLARQDFAGLAMTRHTLRNRSYEPPPVRGRSDRVDALVEAGHTGVAAGRGFFDWSAKTPAEWYRERDRRILALKRALRDLGGPLRGA